MKTQLKLACMMVLFAIMGFSSCVTSTKPSEQIIGNWKITDCQMSFLEGEDEEIIPTGLCIGKTWSFFKDGTVRLAMIGNEGAKEYTSTFTIENDKLTIKGGDLVFHPDLEDNYEESLVLILNISEITSEKLVIDGKMDFYENGKPDDSGTIKISFTRI